MYATVRFVDFKEYKRVIIISDIHGDKDGFLGILDKVKFCEDDALVILGDIIEKGKYSLDLLHLVMEYYKKGNLYLVAGNNDTIFSDWMDDEVSERDVLWYVTHKKYSIILDMAEKLQLPYETMEAVRRLRDGIKEHFQKEIRFLNGLPHILESDIATFVHAGIKPGDLDKQDRSYCLTALEFAKQPHVFSKQVIVGHWPSSNYGTDVIEANVFRNRETNVISMDGGNSMKRWQQINYLILDNEGEELESGYYDNLPKIQALDDQDANTDYITLIFPNTMLEIREAGEEKSVCYIPWLNKELIIDNHRIYEYKGKTYCSDLTTYNLPIRAGDILSCCGQTKEGLQVKRAGIVGNYHGRYVEI